jgi:hypothetical protein
VVDNGGFKSLLETGCLNMDPCSTIYPWQGLQSSLPTSLHLYKDDNNITYLGLMGALSEKMSKVYTTVTKTSFVLNKSQLLLW